MSAIIVLENSPQLHPRSPVARPGPIPDFRLESLFQERGPSLLARAASSATTTSDATVASYSCSPKNTTGVCERPTSDSTNNTTVPIVLGVVLPLGVALIILVILHRRHVKKLRKEDAEDKNKSLDFGLGGDGVMDGSAAMKKRGRKGQKTEPEMTMSDAKNAIRQDRGLSMDMAAGNPYLLPPEVQNSRESLRSLSRTGDDKYRATDFIPDDGSIRSPSSLRNAMDDSSSYAGSSQRRFDTESNKGLLRDTTNGSKRTGPVSARQSLSKEVYVERPQPARNPRGPASNNLLAPGQSDANRDSYLSTTSSVGATAALRASNNYLGAFISGGSPPANEGKKESQKNTTTTVTEIKVQSPVEEVRSPPLAFFKDDGASQQLSSGPNDSAISLSADRQPRLPQLSFIDSQGLKQSSLGPEISVTEHSSGLNTGSYASSSPSNNNHQNQHSNLQEQKPTLPNIEVQHQDSEDDYYDEDMYDDYEESTLGYDPRRLTMGMRPLPPDDPSENPEQRANRIRSFYKEYFDDSVKTPGIQPQTQAPVQYLDGSENYTDNYAPKGYYDRPHYQPQQGNQRGGKPGRHRATISNGSFMSGPNARAMSAASGRAGPAPRQMPPKKNQPPPKPLAVLPTPHMLKDDSYLPMAADFAPPNLAKFQRAGTPDSLRGGLRAYSPSTRAHTPLVSSFDDLAVMPSPHSLRKSGTFTALDFAPPGRVRTGDYDSDSGSVRSNGSGISAVHRKNIKKGAYRVSRIPKEVAGTKSDFATSLRPQWDMNR